MQKMIKKQIEDYEQMWQERGNARLRIPESLYFICEANNYNPEAIGRHFLEILARMNSEQK